MKFVATKKSLAKIFFSPLSFLPVFGSGIRDPRSGMGKNQDPGSGIRDKHPGSATLLLLLLSFNFYISEFRKGLLFGIRFTAGGKSLNNNIRSKPINRTQLIIEVRLSFWSSDERMELAAAWIFSKVQNHRLRSSVTDPDPNADPDPPDPRVFGLLDPDPDPFII